jgi:cell division protein FtsN
MMRNPSPTVPRRTIGGFTPRRVRGGFTIGLVVGLLIGLSLALGVALYVTKAPNPFVNKVPPRPAGSDQAEAEKNRAWDPNASLASRAPMPAPAAPALSASVPQLVPPTVTDPLVGLPASAASAASAPGRRASSPREIAVERALAQAQAEGRDPVAALATPPSGSDPFIYFVQAGAFARSEDAEQQRAKLAMAGVESKLFERDQAGRTVWRVRVGPFSRKEEADAAKEKLGDAGVDAALVRVQR